MAATVYLSTATVYLSTATVYLSTATVYLSTAAVDHLTAAQQVLDEHTISSASGLCLRCHHVGPCPTSERAVALARYGRLSHRKPGATRPELINARRVTVRPNPSTTPASLSIRRYEP